MRVQVLSSGSRGNATLVRAGERVVLVDAGLGPRVLRARLDAAGVGLFGIDHVLVSHAHLDHSRSAGKIARSYRATLHATPALLAHRACAPAPAMAAIPAVGEFTLGEAGDGEVRVRTLTVPHDCDPTLAFRFEHSGRVLAYVTDLGEVRDDLRRALFDPHVLVVESNHDEDLLANGPYPAELKRRVAGPRGHLSNAAAAELVAALAGPRLHTVVLAHLSEKNNTPALALAATRGALERVGRGDVALVVAAQDVVSPEVLV